MPNICIENMSFAYEDRAVIQNLDLNFDYGQAYRIAGPNGVGKTTLLKLIHEDLCPDSGLVRAQSRVEDNIFLSDKNRLDPHLSFNDHLNFLKSVKQLKCPEAFLAQLIEQLHMLPYLDIVTADLSLGTKKKLSFILTLAQKPRTLILDEFFSGIDSAGMQVICGYLNVFVQEGNTLLFVTHADEKLGCLQHKTISF
ncbi:ABC transporter ATP-binding protein [Oenococcus sp.]|uniref:ABC transporter ATP-binding protein n=1 Tax=Oenococcus sp. TaxID=1979414 RepID=UPI0039E74668